MPYPCLLPKNPCPHSSPLLTHTSSGDTQTQFCLSLWVLVCTRLVWTLWVSLVGMGFDSKPDFAPPTILLGLLLCSWAWSITSQSLQHCAAAAPAPIVLLGFPCPWMWGIIKPQNDGPGGLLERSIPLLHSSATNAPTSPPNCQGLKKQEKSEKQAQPGEALGDKMICCQVASWMALFWRLKIPEQGAIGWVSGWVSGSSSLPGSRWPPCFILTGGEGSRWDFLFLFFQEHQG